MRKLRIAMTVPLPAQRDATEIGTPPYMQQRGGFTALYSAVPEHRGFPGENASMISSGLVAQSRGGEVHDDRILNRHFVYGVDEDALDPVI